MASDNSDTIGDFISHWYTTQPGLLDIIFTKLMSSELSTCRLVAKSWMEYVDKDILGCEKRRNIVEQSPQMEAWADIPRNVKVFEVFREEDIIDFVTTAIYEEPFLIIGHGLCCRAYKSWKLVCPIVRMPYFFTNFELSVLPMKPIISTKDCILFSYFSNSYMIFNRNNYTTDSYNMLRLTVPRGEKVYTVAKGMSHEKYPNTIFKVKSNPVGPIIKIDVDLDIVNSKPESITWRLSKPWKSLHHIDAKLLIGVNYCPLDDLDQVYYLDFNSKHCSESLMYTRKKCRNEKQDCTFSMFSANVKGVNGNIIIDQCNCYSAKNHQLICYSAIERRIEQKENIVALLNVHFVQLLAFILVQKSDEDKTWHELICIEFSVDKEMITVYPTLKLDSNSIPWKINWLSLGKNKVIIPFDIESNFNERNIVLKIFGINKTKSGALNLINSIFWNWTRPNAIKNQVINIMGNGLRLNDPLFMLDTKLGNIMVLTSYRSWFDSVGYSVFNVVHALSLKKASIFGDEVNKEKEGEENMVRVEMQ